MWGFLKRIRLKSTVCKYLLTVGIGLTFSIAYGQTVAEVKLLWKTQAGGITTTLLETTGYTNTTATSPTLPEINGYRFTRWEVTPAGTPNFANRDAFGRAFESVSVVPKEDTIITAIYEETTLDSDGDGLADAEEMYWCGSLTYSATSDTDNDGYTFAQELQYALNPHFPDTLIYGGIRYGDSSTFWYNPNSYSPYMIQSNPEGKFATQSGYLSPGQTLVTSSYASEQTFGYWSIDGVRQADAFGRALDQVTLVGDGNPDHILTVTAHFFENVSEQQIAYWYGPDSGVTPDSDTDGDGYTFAQEMQYGLNPYFKDALVYGGIRYGDSSTFWYNPNSYSPYTIQSNPEGKFATQSGYLKQGQPLTTTSYASDKTFGYWALNGIRQADAFGRALDSVTLQGDGDPENPLVATAHFFDGAAAQQLAYWYGPDSGVTPESDTDGDGYTFAQEMQYGLNPYFKDALVYGGVRYGDSATQEVNLQPFDMGTHLLVQGSVTRLFATLNSVTGELSGGLDFNGALAPVVLDVNGDGLNDLLLATPDAITLYRNIGTEGSPDFEIVEKVYPTLQHALSTMTRPLLCNGMLDEEQTIAFCDQGGCIAYYNLANNTITQTATQGFPVWSATDGWGAVNPEGFALVLQDGATLSLDVATPTLTSAALSDIDLDGQADLLIADAEGRIALYLRENGAFVLQHRVWGGSYAGFATGLALAPIDWEPDGDIDALAGTADGHLLLLRNPGVGRPMNLQCVAGYDNVLLTWDPNQQSRVSGYTVYRATTETANFENLDEVALPTYRDTPPTIATWDYRVTTLSRQWLSGNSEPQIAESLPSDIATVKLGGIELALPETLTAYDNQEIALPIHINNTVGLRGDGTRLSITYDDSILEPVTIQTTAISEKVTFTTLVSEAFWNVSAAGGIIDPGSGIFVTFIFKIKASATGTTPIQLTTATFFSEAGTPVSTNTLPLTTLLTIQQRPQPAIVSLNIPNQAVETEQTVTLPLTATTLGDLNWATLQLTATATNGITVTSLVPPTANNEGSITLSIPEMHGENLTATVTISGSATSANGLPAEVIATTATLAITDSNPLKPTVVSLSLPNQAVETEQTVTLPLTATTIGKLNWATLKLTAVATNGITVTFITPPTANNEGSITLSIPEMHGENLTATVTVSGSATSANGLPAEVIATTATLTITDSNPLKPSIVSLSVPNQAVETEQVVTLPLTATTVGELNWETLKLTAVATNGITVTFITPPTANNEGSITLSIPEMHGENLTATVTISGSATSANGLLAEVIATTATLTITDNNPLKPTVVSLNLPNQAVETEQTVTLPLTATTVGDLNWATLKLTAMATNGITVTSLVPPTANNKGSITLSIPEMHGENLTATVTVSGSATSANGLPAEVVSTTATLTITDSNPLKPSIVSLSVPNQAVETEQVVTLPLTATTVGDLNWATLKLTAVATNGIAVTSLVPPTANNEGSITLSIPEMHGENLTATVTVSGSATSANGLPAEVITTTATLTITDSNPLKPAIVSLSLPNQAVETEQVVTLPLTATTVGDLNWATLKLTAVATNGITVTSITPPTANNEGSITLSIPEMHGENLTATVSVSGSAMSANGLPAEVIATTATLTITDSNPLKPSIVSLSVPNQAVETEQVVTLPLTATTVGELNWETLQLTATATNGIAVTSLVPPTANNEGSITLSIPEMHGENLTATITVSGSATSANGLPAEVIATTATLTITDSNPLKPTVVSLSLPNQAVETERIVTLPLTATTVGDLNWATLQLTATATNGIMVISIKPPTANGEGSLSLTIPEMHGENLKAMITVSGLAMSANGLPAEVIATTATLTITDSNPLKPTVVSLSLPNQAVETERTVTLPLTATTVGDLNWATLQLTATATNGITVTSLVPPTANNEGSIMLSIPEMHGENLTATVTVSGSATSANGLPAEVIATTATLTITDSNPLKPSIVSLSIPNQVVETEQVVTLPLTATTIGDLNWATLQLTATATNGIATTSLVPPTANNEGSITLSIPEMHGENLTAIVTVSGSATSANGLPAEVIATTATLTILIPEPPANAVPEWTNGDCNGDGFVTLADLDIARAAFMSYHSPMGKLSQHSANGEDMKIHNSICAALGKPKNATLTMSTDFPLFIKYVENLIGTKE